MLATQTSEVMAVAPRNNNTWTKHLVNGLLYLGGIGLFVHLVRSSGMHWDFDFGASLIAWLFVASIGVPLFDTLAWRVSALGFRDELPLLPLGSLFFLRVAGESVTAGVPGGLVFGEAYKAVKMRDWFGLSFSQTTPGLLLIKFGLGFSQAIFILLGLAFSYGRISEKSEEVFGIPGVQWVALFLLLFMCLFMAAGPFLFYKGQPFERVLQALSVLPFAFVKRWIADQSEKVSELDARCTALVVGNEKKLAWVLLLLFGRWFSGAAESFVILLGLGLLPESLFDAVIVALAIESLGSMFRLVFFIVSSGIGGQDASFFALFRLFSWTSPMAGTFIVIKRAKELFWIALGFLFLFMTRFLGLSIQSSGWSARPPELHE